MNIKPCRQCGELAEHYSSVVTCCKKCWRARVTARRNAKIDEIRAYDRERAKLPHRKQMFIEKTRRKRKDKNFDLAHKAVAVALARGTLVRPLRCSRCGAKHKDIEAHHDNHANYLDIMWLCPICHAARHKELGLLNK